MRSQFVQASDLNVRQRQPNAIGIRLPRAPIRPRLVCPEVSPHIQRMGRIRQTLRLMLEWIINILYEAEY